MLKINSIVGAAVIATALAGTLINPAHADMVTPMGQGGGPGDWNRPPHSTGLAYDDHQRRKASAKRAHGTDTGKGGNWASDKGAAPQSPNISAQNPFPGFGAGTRGTFTFDPQQQAVTSPADNKSGK
jgi:hypothetical protein